MRESPSVPFRGWLVTRAVRDKPRRDRTRRGAGSGTREVPGPRARGHRYDERVSGSWTHPPKPGVTPAALAPRVNASRASRRAKPLMAQQRKCAHRCLRGDGDTQKLGRFRMALPAWLSSGRLRREGSAPTTRRLHSCGAWRRRCEDTASAVSSQGSREPGGVRHGGVQRAGLTEAGDG